MGRYYGVINATKLHKVSSYWKNSLPCIDEIERMAIIFGWDINNDKIYAGSYCDQYIFDNVNSCWHQYDGHPDEQPNEKLDEQPNEKLNMQPAEQLDMQPAEQLHMQPDSSVTVPIQELDDTVPEYKPYFESYIGLGFDECSYHNIMEVQDVPHNIMYYSAKFSDTFFYN